MSVLLKNLPASTAHTPGSSVQAIHCGMLHSGLPANNWIEKTVRCTYNTGKMKKMQA